MAFQPTQPTALRAPPRHFLFASQISGEQGKYTLSKAEIDDAIRRHGTNIAVMVDVGGRIQPEAAAHDMLKYLQAKGVQHIGVYTEGRTGPTGKSYNPAELARRHDLARQYKMSDEQWMSGGWQKHFHDQIRHYSKEYGASFFEADNIPQGQTIDFMLQLQAEKDKGNLPANTQMLLKNPNASEIQQLGAALNDRSIRRSTVADFAISEEDDKGKWPALRDGLREYGVQLATSDDTNRYAAKQSYEQTTMAALNRLPDAGREQGWRINAAPPAQQQTAQHNAQAKPEQQPPFRMRPV